MPAHRTTSRPAFTLLEVIIVTVCIAILATVVTVRMGSLLPRRAQVTVSQVTNILDALAHRTVLGQSAVAIEYDDDSGQIWLERYTTAEEFNSSNTQRRSEWVRDILVPTVKFDEQITLDAAYFDGRRNTGDFRIEIQPGQARPLIEIDIAWDTAIETIALLPTEQRAFVRSKEDFLRPVSEDLDETGKEDEQW